MDVKPYIYLRDLGLELGYELPNSRFIPLRFLRLPQPFKHAMFEMATEQVRTLGLSNVAPGGKLVPSKRLKELMLSEEALETLRDVLNGPGGPW